MTWSLDKLGPHIARALQIPVARLSDSFRPGRPDELPAILRLRRDVYPEGIWWDDEAFVRWRSFRPDRPADFWVFEKDGQLMAGLGLEPVELVVDGQAHPAVRSLDIMVHPTYEGAGLGAVINLLLFARHPVSLVMGSNPRSHTLISRMFTRVLDLQSWKLLIKSQDAIEQRWGLGPLAKPAALAADAGLALQRWRLARQSTSQLEVREITAFDDRVTAVSRAVESRGGIMVRRSADYLNWRFLQNPRIEYRAFGGFVGDTLAAYVVVRFNERRDNPRKIAEVVDWLQAPAATQTTPREGADVASLWSAAIAPLVAAGARIVAGIASPAAAGDLFDRSGFVHRPEELLPFFVHAESPLRERVSAPAGWYLTGCDFDVE